MPSIICTAVTVVPESVPCASISSPTLMSPTAISTALETFALSAFTVYEVPSLPVTVIVDPDTAVTVPRAPIPGPPGPPWPIMPMPRPITPSTIFVAIIEVPDVVPCTITVSPTAISVSVAAAGVTPALPFSTVADDASTTWVVTVLSFGFVLDTVILVPEIAETLPTAAGRMRPMPRICAVPVAAAAGAVCALVIPANPSPTDAMTAATGIPIRLSVSLFIYSM